jgi:hypothetical protein
MRTAQAILILLATSLAVGCSDRPRAPVLSNDPVYQDDREGLRFLAPEGWTQSGKANLPHGKSAKERTLVDYRRASGTRGASFRVTLADLDPSTDLADFLAGLSYGVQKWHLTAPPETVPVGNASGLRYKFSSGPGKAELIKDVIAVRRGDRVYFFTALYGPADTEVQGELGRVVSSVIWKN